jgi:RNA polymerase sigma-70 factor, ECF subfamily
MRRPASVGDDEEASRIVAGPRDAALLRALYERHAPWVYGYLRHVIADPGAAEDLLQEVFVDAWYALGRYDPARGSVRAWLMAMARSRALDHLRRRRADERREAAAAEARELGRDGADGVGDDGHVRRSALRQAVRDLPEEQRRALFLVYYLDLTHREAARRLDLPVGTLKGRLRLSMGHLRRWLETGSKEG